MCVVGQCVYMYALLSHYGIPSTNHKIKEAVSHVVHYASLPEISFPTGSSVAEEEGSITVCVEFPSAGLSASLSAQATGTASPGEPYCTHDCLLVAWL